MKPYSSPNFDLVGFTLGLLMILGLFAEGFIPKYVSIHSTLYHLIQFLYIFFASLYWFYAGNKKMHQRREQQPEHAYWYTQPGILFALGGFLILPYFLLQLVIGEATLNTLPEPLAIALYAPSGVCILAAIFFYFWGLRKRKTG